jgi:hypothetical protein
LQEVGGVFRQKAKLDIVSSTKLSNIGGHVCCKVIAYDNFDVLSRQALDVGQEHPFAGILISTVQCAIPYLITAFCFYFCT